ncbi:hypothetical protein O7599_10015 [Streptomyces sp. WMMC500]|uniref:hypothetical protein n=1 Tax=Streptomyces sp. WMMC500 TaxID=3015154 RepID=UPI00248CC587|nr:hypothetical protein [Streptomyces sp. WMMC500]WBB62834.1 hypothetical protein O7599_10015 [Streptomyces sp. WMMC500]
MILRTIANPRRTTLAHLDDAADLLLPEPPEAAWARTDARTDAAAPAAQPPERTANPRRTVLEEVPSGA